MKIDDSTVLVGNKPLSTYVLSANKALDRFGKITIKARGKFILTAINTALITNANIGLVKLATDRKEIEGRELRVSTIEISLNR